MIDVKLLINDICSITGSAFLLFAYYKVSTNRWNNNDPIFYIINFIGAVLALAGITYRFNFSVLIIEVVFGFMSIRGYLRTRKKDFTT